MTAQSQTSRRLFLAAGSASAVFGALSQAVALESGDAALLELGKRLEAAWARENTAWARADASRDESVSSVARSHNKISRQIVDEIIKLKAQTLEGLKVKARSLAWCHTGDFKGIADDEPTTDMRVADSILFDLVALAGATA